MTKILIFFFIIYKVKRLVFNIAWHGFCGVLLTTKFSLPQKLFFFFFLLLLLRKHHLIVVVTSQVTSY